MIPDFLTRADWDIPIQAAADAVTKTGGHGFGVNDIEAIIRIAERFEGTFFRVANKILELKNTEQKVDPQFESPFDSGDQGRTVEGITRAEPAKESLGAVPQEITADKVYSVLLGALNMAQQTFPDMTASEMLEKAREMKGIIVPEIEAQLIKMVTPDK